LASTRFTLTSHKAAGCAGKRGTFINPSWCRQAAQADQVLQYKSAQFSGFTF
jgi:hypothetical protein